MTRLDALSEWSDRHFKWLLVAPAVLLILALSVYPLLFSLWVLFVNYDFTVPGHAFVGLRNFTRVLADPVARWSLWVTVLLSTINVVIEFLLGLALALAMVKNFRGRGIIMSLFIIPLFISPVIVGQAWALLLQRPFGPTNFVLTHLLGHEVSIGWLTEAPWNFIAIIIVDVWQWTPFMFLIMLAGLSNLNPELYEAAALDGAGWWQELREITLPGLAPVIAVAIVFRGLDAFKIFDQIFMLTQGQPGTSTETISWYIYQIGYKFFNMGYGAAVSYLLLIFLTVAATLYASRFLREERL